MINYLCKIVAEKEIDEYVMNYELSDDVPIFDKSESGDNLFNTIFISFPAFNYIFGSFNRPKFHCQRPNIALHHYRTFYVFLGFSVEPSYNAVSYTHLVVLCVTN